MTNAGERARLWAEDERFDPQTRERVREIMSDEQELLSCFGTELAFGTGGLRGLLGVGVNRMNEYTVGRATQGLADYLKQRGGGSVAVAHDSRLRSREFALFAAGVLAHNGVAVWLYPRLAPTPMLSFATRELHCAAGIVVTASHNPAQYNGYKVYGADGCQITQAAAEAVTACMEKVAYGEPVSMPEEEAREKGLLRDVPPDVEESFLERALACRVAPEAKAPLRVVYTPLHGDGLEPVTKALSRMKGIETVVVPEQAVPDGRFPTCPKPNPELREALRLGLELAAREKAPLVLATDPDCDRVGVAVRQRDGGYVVLTGNEVGLLMMEHVLKHRARNRTLPGDPIVVKTIVTSDLAFAIARRYGARVLERLTGFKYIGETIGELEKQGTPERFVFGFEESCGYLAGVHVRDKDGVMACILAAEMAQCAAEEGRTLAEEMQRLYETYGYMEDRLLNFDISGAEPMKETARIMASLRGEPVARLAGTPVETVRDYAPGVDGLPRSDVIAYRAADGKKAVVRPSGTEPKVKVYLSARAENRQEAEKALDAMEKEFRARIEP